jgi:hypothetical protein
MAEGWPPQADEWMIFWDDSVCKWQPGCGSSQAQMFFAEKTSD